MRLVAVADLHGHLPDVPPCDLLLIAGDVCPASNHAVGFQRQWLNGKFARWIASRRCQAEKVVWIAGNHDLALELGPPGPALPEVATYLQDSSVVVGGLKIYGTPWSEIIGPWAFSLEERMTPDPRRPWRPKVDLEVAFSLIPDDADIILCHQPPYGILDRAVDGTHLGSPSLLRRVRKVCPRLVVYGHVHEAHGSETRALPGEAGALEPVTCANASLVDERYRPRNKPLAFEL